MRVPVRLFLLKQERAFFVSISPKRIVRMNERKSILDKLVNNWSNHLVKDYVEILLYKLLEYYEIYDLDQGTNHYYIFKALYRSSKKKSYEDISEEYYISISMLKRYIKRYDKLAIKVIKKDGKVNIINRSKDGLLK